MLIIRFPKRNSKHFGHVIKTFLSALKRSCLSTETDVLLLKAQCCKNNSQSTLRKTLVLKSSKTSVCVTPRDLTKQGRFKRTDVSVIKEKQVDSEVECDKCYSETGPDRDRVLVGYPVVEESSSYRDAN